MSAKLLPEVPFSVYEAVRRERDIARADLAEAMGYLRSREWTYDLENDDWRCGTCGNSEGQGHLEVCTLNALLQKGQEKK